MEPSQKLIEELFEKGILINKDFFEKSSSQESELTEKLLEKITVESDLVVLSSDYVDVLKQSSSLVDWYEIDKYRVDAEKDRDDELYQTQLQSFKTSSLTVDASISHSSISAVHSSDSSTHFPNDSLSKKIDETEPVESQQVTSLEVTLDSSNSSSFKTTSSFLETLHSTSLTPLEITSLKSLSSLSSSSHSNSSLVSPTHFFPMVPSVSFSSPLQQTINIVLSYKNTPKKYTVQDFTHFFLTRYTYLESILRNRQELQGLTTINRVLQKKEKEEVVLNEELFEPSKVTSKLVTCCDSTGSVSSIFFEKESFGRCVEELDECTADRK